jgi:hypothetical protein
VTVAPPPGYGIAPFFVAAYNADMLAAMKIAAVMSERRHAPRDIYDLHDLIGAGANPVPLLARQDVDLLEHTRQTALAKLERIGFDLAREELLPYLPKSERDALTEDRWTACTLAVGESIEQWTAAAIAMRRAEPQE